jgi:hypothetical protein
VAINLLDFVFFPPLCGRIFALATVLSSVLIYNLPETVSFFVSRMHIRFFPQKKKNAHPISFGVCVCVCVNFTSFGC